MWPEGRAAARLALLLLLAAGCRTLPPVPADHVVMVDGRGRLVDPTGNVGCREGQALCRGRHSYLVPYRPLGTAATEAYLDRVVAALRRHRPGPDGRRHVLLFIHGGLNTQVGSVERAARLAEAIAATGAFPIFVNWQSSLLSSYFDHLFNVRQGEPWGWKGWWMAPVYLATDVARGVARAPQVWAFLLWNDLKTLPHVQRPDQEAARRVADEIEAQGGPFPLAEGVKDRSPWEMALSGATWLLTLPTKLLTAPFLDAFGTSAWDDMLRRTELLFHTDAEYGPHPEGPGTPPSGYLGVAPQGALARFLGRLTRLVAEEGGPGAWEITLVGHSMGTLVLNRVVRDFGETPAGPMPYDRIVYMAAACSIADYEESLFPYLARNPRAQVYHLTLHDVADLRERWDPIPYLDLPPRGSLLVWIDSFLADPLTPRQRTAGRFVNLAVSLHDTPPALRPRIHVREFDVGRRFRATDPQEHGDLSRPFHFWDPACWWPGAPDPAACMEDAYR